MTSGLRALLTGIIDYAGLFPPAGLPMAEAFRNFLQYRDQDEGWMLSRFVCPAERLDELAPFLEEFSADDAPLAFAVLGKGGKTMRDFLQGTIEDLEAMVAFVQDHGEDVQIETYEARLPLDLLTPGHGDDLRAAVHGPAAMLDEAGMPPIAAFYELPADRPWAETLPLLTAAILADPDLAAGVKFRCGGLDAASIPASADLGRAIAACARDSVPMKFTAGLHHPIRNMHAGMHGFINAFAAGVLAQCHGLNDDQVHAIIEDADARNFDFDDVGVRWRDHRATTAEIVQAREQAVTSFGSCSFDEPRADLRTLGWLP